MRELANTQDNRQAERAMTEERGPKYSSVHDETLPPIGELIREHDQMVMERLEEKRMQDRHFAKTLYEWSLRERGKL